MGLLRSLLRLGRRASDDEVVPDRPIYPPEDTLALGFEEVFVTLALVVLSYVVLATPCSSERRRWGSGGAHAGGRPDAAGGTATARWADALGQIRHVRSAEDLRRWWRRFRRTGGRADGRHGTVSFDPQRWDAVMRTGRHHDDDGVAASDRTVRASGGRGAPSAPLRSVFRPSVGGSNAHQKIHSSTSDGHLVGWSARGARGVGGEPPFYEGGFRPETDHDRFEKAWRSHICSAEYRRLVLPPECKLVEFVSRGEATEHYFLVESKVKEVASYLRNIFDILCGLFSKEGTRRFSVWIVGILHHNSRRRRGLAVEEDDETDEDDDDGSVTTLASNSSKRPTKGGQNQNHTHPEVSSVAPVNRTNSTENGEDDRKFSSPNCARQVGEETTREEEDRGDENDSSFMNVPSLATSNKRKESHSEKSLNDDATFVSASASAVESEDVNLDRSNSFSSRSPGIPLSVEGRPRSSLNVSPLPTKNYHCKPKKRDSLESYRRPEVKPIAMPSLKLAKDLAPEPDRVNLMPSSRKTNSQNPVATFRESSDMSFFDTANSSKDLRDMSRAVPIPDANGYILGDEFLGSSCTPLLVFVNSRSGPQQGHLLITQFRRLLNPIQVWDLANGGPEKVLKSFSVLSRFQVLVCGGDGTVSWIISSLERMSLKRWPPIGILPLGTGNDLARIHGWGGGYNNESLIYILRQLSEAYISILDLWELDITSTTKKGKQKKEVKAFLNYLGVGVDAQAALQVHLLRESKPKLFFSRMINKVHYAVAGGEEALKSSCANLSQQITLKADGREIPLPPDSQGIIFLNIDSYSGGVPMWSKGLKPQLKIVRRYSESDYFHANGNGLARNDSIEDLAELETARELTACDLPSSPHDGLLDVVSIRGTFHLGQIRVGLSNAQLICQCREATVTLKKKIAVQIDGEPWRQNPSILRIVRKPEQATMLNRSDEDSGGIETEVTKLLNWANERDVIDRNQYALMMEEFSRRTERKKRRQKQRGNGFSFIG